jgi:hypothetical protein
MGTNININKDQGGNKCLIIIILVLLLGLAITTECFYKQKAIAIKEAEAAQVMAGNADALINELAQIKVKINDTTEVMAAQTFQLTLQREDFRRLYKAEADLTRRLKKNISDIQSLTAISVVSIDTVYTPVYIDSTESLAADYTSQWIDITARIPKDKQDQARFTYNHRQELEFIKTVEQGRLFWGLIKWKKNKTATYTAISKDENSTITKLTYKEIIK